MTGSEALPGRLGKLAKTLDEMAAEIVRLRGALTFYASPWDGRQALDGGKLATETLTAHLQRGGS